MVCVRIAVKERKETSTYKANGKDNDKCKTWQRFPCQMPAEVFFNPPTAREFISFFYTSIIIYFNYGELWNKYPLKDNKYLESWILNKLVTVVIQGGLGLIELIRMWDEGSQTGVGSDAQRYISMLEKHRDVRLWLWAVEMSIGFMFCLTAHIKS